MRSAMSPAEAVLWRELRQRKLGEWSRQHPLAGSVLDFYCPAARLCVEVDGDRHESDRHQALDHARTMNLSALGVDVVRVANDEVLQNVDAVLTRIHQSGTDPLPSPARGRGWRGAQQRRGRARG